MIQRRKSIREIQQNMADIATELFIRRQRAVELKAEVLADLKAQEEMLK